MKPIHDCLLFGGWIERLRYKRLLLAEGTSNCVLVD